MSIWFCHLLTDWLAIRKPTLRGIPFVLAAPERGRMCIKSVSIDAHRIGVEQGMVVADVRALFPDMEVLEEEAGRGAMLLKAIAEWCIRYSPLVAIDAIATDGLILDISGCAHLWGGEGKYLIEVLSKFKKAGYHVRAAIADTVGTAWASAHFGKDADIVKPGGQLEALLSWPPAALRLDPVVLDRMQKLGFYQIKDFVQIPRSVLRRRFGQPLLDRMAQALGEVEEALVPIQPPQPYQERLPCLEPIRTAVGIGMALEKLLEMVCQRLSKEGKGLRNAIFRGYRIDGKKQEIAIGTNQPVRHVKHLFKLFELKIATMRPGLGIELFILEVPVVEDLSPTQETLWNMAQGADHKAILNLLDRVGVRVGMGAIHRYLPAEHYWPERSIKRACSFEEKATTAWRNDLKRPVNLLGTPHRIEVTAPIPDYPPMVFRYKGHIHQVRKADGPERIEQEWWQEQGLHRDYYCVEDERGARYWIFRLGNYGEDDPQWFIHGFFA